MTTALTTRITAGTGATVKNLPLSSAEIDNNFLSLNDNKLELAGGTTITTLGTIATGTWSATTIATNKGGTGLTTYTSGQLLIGNSSGSLSAANLTGTTNQISVTNGSGSITLALPQDIASASNVQHGSLGIGTAGSGVTGEIRATNSITSYYSDDRLKNNLGNIPNALEKVMSLNGFYYEANQVAQDLGYKPKREVGVSAQQVQAVLQEAVVPAPIDEQYLTVHYERLVPLLIEAIKELKHEINVLKGIE